MIETKTKWYTITVYPDKPQYKLTVALKYAHMPKDTAIMVSGIITAMNTIGYTRI